MNNCELVERRLQKDAREAQGTNWRRLGHITPPYIHTILMYRKGKSNNSTVPGSTHIVGAASNRASMDARATSDPHAHLYNKPSSPAASVSLHMCHSTTSCVPFCSLNIVSSTRPGHSVILCGLLIQQMHLFSAAHAVNSNDICCWDRSLEAT